MSEPDPFQTERPEDPRGGFQTSPEGCINGTAWGGEITLDGSPIEAPYAEYQGYSVNTPYPANPPA